MQLQALDIVIEERNIIFAAGVESRAWENPTKRVISRSTNFRHKGKLGSVGSVAAAHLQLFNCCFIVEDCMQLIHHDGNDK